MFCHVHLHIRLDQSSLLGVENTCTISIHHPPPPRGLVLECRARDDDYRVLVAFRPVWCLFSRGSLPFPRRSLARHSRSCFRFDLRKNLLRYLGIDVSCLFEACGLNEFRVRKPAAQLDITPSRHDLQKDIRPFELQRSVCPCSVRHPLRCLLRPCGLMLLGSKTTKVVGCPLPVVI
jgi:hypothetical protein